MPSEPVPIRSAEKWPTVAKGDLVIARHPRDPEVPWELLAFHAQQAAEKALKAVLVHRGIRPPRTHDLDEILGVYRQRGVRGPPNAGQLPRLTPWAVEARYPGAGFEDATEEDFRAALELADAVVGWAEKVIHSPG